MKALINTFNSIQNDSIGTVISLHRTVEAAQKSNDRLQRRIRTTEGQNSYIPTRIVTLTRKHCVGLHVHPMNVRVEESHD